MSLLSDLGAKVGAEFKSHRLRIESLENNTYTIDNVNTALSTKLDIINYNATDILTKLKTVDGMGSGLDSQFLQGYAPTSGNISNTIVMRDASGNFAAGIISASLQGNAQTATKLQTSRTIAGVTFDGSTNINIPYNNLTGLPIIPVVPTTLSSFMNDIHFQTDIDVNNAIQSIIGAAPAALDTLAEIATQLSNDESAVSALTNIVSNKVDKISGKGLSSEDYTLDEKTKLGSIEEQANNYVHPTSSVVAGTYSKVTVDSNGHITNAINPSTLGGYGITDAQTTLISGNNIKTINGTSVLGSGDIVTTQTTITGNAGTATKLQTTRTINGVSFDGSSNIVISDSTKLPLAGGIMTGAITAIRETKVVMSANDINLASGNLFTKTITIATTFTVSGVLPSPAANSFMLELTNGGAATVTWWSGVKWAGGTAPTLTTAGVDILGFYSHDGGTTWRGMVMAKDSK